ncbi:uncharacterized protein LOC119078914 [Bradysia coprophila]|uniref:uncharacterized protein LOC119078914 n=1 Tax=Bradysia coprophila TaxID=38358 RepID=UPI00187DD504|nr:uncharacterized protein LOC119078914 [Bradysia coprophila]
MEINYGEDELQEIIKLNGQTVSNALAMLKNNATETEISDYISNYTGQPTNLVAREVTEILRFAVNNGFLVKNGNTYKLPSQNCIYNVDCDASGSGVDEGGKTGAGPDIGGNESDSSSNSGAENVSVEVTTEEGSEAACVDGVEEEEGILPETLKELMNWFDISEFDSAIDLPID